MATLRELLEQYKDKIKDGGLKVRDPDWGAHKWYNVLGLSATHTIGFYQDGYGEAWSLDTDDWELYLEPDGRIDYWE